jgi:acetate kinase
MSDTLLVLNAGSSSLKYSVYCTDVPERLQLDARGQIESIGGSARFVVRDGAGAVLSDRPLAAKDASAAFDALAAWLGSRYPNARLRGVGHRVVHGGAKYSVPTRVTLDVLEELESLVPLAPLHQPHNLAAIEVVSLLLPDVPQVACFDTSFHRGQPAVAELIPLPRAIRATGVQRYGFHGLSYEYIASALPEEIADARVIVAHLGSGASLCAMKHRKSLDSSLGFTALDGLCMGTRPGALDPGVVLYLFQSLGLSAQEVETTLYRQSGLLGISGISNDMRDLLGSREAGARLAVDYFVYRAAKEIGAQAAVLGGIDALVFTAGIGENSAEIRQRICEASAWLGIELDGDANRGGGPRLTRATSRVSAWVIPTDEELMIARHTGSLLALWSDPAQQEGTRE